jgi:plasmid replication initiation protein
MGDIIRKPNRIVTAKYNWSKEMLNVLYYIIDELSQKQSKTLDMNLFGETEIKITYSKISNGKLDTEQVRNIIKRFSDPKRWIDYEEVKDPVSGKIIEKSTVLISGMIHEKYSKEITIVVPSLAMPVLLYLGDGFAKIQKTIAFSLNSEYSKRMYELCVKFKDSQGFTYPIIEFKEMFGLKNKYKKLSALKAFVLNVAQKELKEKADVYFTFKSDRGKNRKLTKHEVLIFTIIDKNNPDNPIDRKGNIVYTMLTIAFPVVESDKALTLFNQIQDHENYKNIEFRLLRLNDEFKEGSKTTQDLKVLIPYILKHDFQIKKK